MRKRMAWAIVAWGLVACTTSAVRDEGATTGRGPGANEPGLSGAGAASGVAAPVGGPSGGARVTLRMRGVK